MNRFDTLTSARHRQGHLRPGRPAGADQEDAAVQRGAGPRLAAQAAHALARRPSTRPAASSRRDELLVNAAYNRFRVRLVGAAPGAALRRAACSPAPRSRSRTASRSSASSSSSTRPGWRPCTSRPGSSRSSCPQAARSPTCAPWPTWRTAAPPRTWSSSTRPSTWSEIDVDLVELYTSVARPPGPAGPGPGSRRTSRSPRTASARRSCASSGSPTCRSTPPWCSTSRPPWRTAWTRPRDAALGFLQGTVRPKDRAALITFNDRPHLAVKFTKRRRRAGRRARRPQGRARHRPLRHDRLLPLLLQRRQGAAGDRCCSPTARTRAAASRYEEALDFARRAGVAIYPIGLGRGAGEARSWRSSPRRPAAAPSSSRTPRELAGDLRRHRGGAALPVPDRLPVHEHQRRRRLPRRSSSR